MVKLKPKDLLLVPIVVMGVWSVISISHSGDIPSTVTLGLVFVAIVAYWVFRIIKPKQRPKKAVKQSPIQKHLKLWFVYIPGGLVLFFIVTGIMGEVVKNPVKFTNVYAPLLTGYKLNEFHNNLGNSPDGSHLSMDYEAIGQEGKRYAVNDHPFIQITEFDKSWGSFNPPSNCGLKYPLGSYYWIFNGKKINGHSFYDKVPCHLAKETDGIKIYASDQPRGGDVPAYYVVYKTNIITIFQNFRLDTVSSIVSTLQPTTIEDLQQQVKN